MSSPRELGGKINSLRNMQKVMRAMNMISSIKLKKLFAFQDSLMLFGKTVDEICVFLEQALKGVRSPLASGYKRVERIHLIMFTADKGLCGSHNSSVQKAVSQIETENTNLGVETELTCIGNKGAKYSAGKGYNIYRQSEISDRVFTKDQLKILSDDIFGRFMSGEVQKVLASGNIFHSTLNQETIVQQLLPLHSRQSRTGKTDSGETSGSFAPGDNVAAEPQGEFLASSAGSLYLFYKLQEILLHSLLSEQSSRMTAMENATNNSEDLINKYITMQNHARQASITNELIEIVSGKEALKG